MKEEREDRRIKIIFICAIIFVILSWFACYWYLVGNEFRGTFGDMFGTINALFSGLAFAGVIYTILLQTQELKYQREDNAMTREQLKRSAQAQEESMNIYAQQADAAYWAAKLSGLNSLFIASETRIDELRRQGAMSGGQKNELENLIKKRNEYYNRLAELVEK
ncbi:MAG: hypothetical protein JEZ11_13955 [Desulfobacterales bacterium]|nr:hypothetical protein [Desulfobacterales bacterium]